MPDIEKSNLNIIIPGSGCCNGEMLATRAPLYDIQRFGINFVSIPEDADILVISGFMGEDIIKRIRETYERMKTPRWVFAVGSCAINGGRACGAPALLERLKKEIYIDMHIPGCPPRPEAFIYAILRFISGSIEHNSAKVKNV